MKRYFLQGFFILLSGLQGVLSGQSYTASITSNDTEVCLGDSAAAYLYFSGGVGPWSAIIYDNSGEYLLLADVYSPHTIWLKPDVDNTYYIFSAEDSNGIEATTLAGTVDLIVRQSTPVSIITDRTVFLQSEPVIPLVSSPTGAVFFGVGVSGSAFYPAIAGSGNSPHTISCTYTNPYGCTSNDAVDLHVLSGEASVYLETGGVTVNAVCDDGATYYIHGTNEDNLAGTFELVAAGTTVPIPGHIDDVNLTDNLATFDPVGLSGAYDLVYTYGMEEVSVSATFRFLVNDLGSIGIVDLPDTVCKNDVPYHLIPELLENDPTATFVFSGPGVSGNQADGFFFEPSDPGVSAGEIEITLDYTSSNGCKNKTVKTVYVGFVPTVNFILSPVCLPEDGGTVSFTNMTSGKFSVAGWNWDFDDPESGSNNFSNLEHPEHFYSEPNYRNISLTAITFDGCAANYAQDTILVDQPAVDFTWISDCFIRGQRTQLVDRTVSNLAEIDTLVWTFKTMTGGILGVIGSGSPEDTIAFPFTSMNQYLVDLYIENQVGCSGNLTKPISLKPVRIVPATGYEEDFNSGGDDWRVLSPDQVASWVLDIPDFGGFDAAPGDLAWYTDLPLHTSGYLEQSWVESPCFDLTVLSKPLVKLDLMKSFAPGTDGAVLQYQNYVSEGWETLGYVGDGLNWYNEIGIYNEPGGNNFGWGLGVFTPDTDWLNAGHAVDMLAGQPHVKFRVIIATGGEQPMGNQGFAFDNFFIGERIRHSVLEHFTNASSEAAFDADAVVDAFGSDFADNVIDLQYHMDYPGEDPMNENNPTPPYVRSFQHGVEYVGVPYAVLNGGLNSEWRFTFSGPSGEPTGEILEEASLDVPIFDMSLQVNYMESEMDGTVKVTCTADTFTSNLDLYVVVIEREVTAYRGNNQDTSFRNVVLDWLPPPDGSTLLGNSWNRGKTETTTFSWSYAAYVEDVEDLSVVAFVQNRDNGEILQSIARPHTAGVNVNRNYRDPGMMTVYPNPAGEQLYVHFGNNMHNKGRLEVTDLSGRIVMHADVQPGYSVQLMDVAGLSGGIYTICWMESGTVRARKKIMIAR